MNKTLVAALALCAVMPAYALRASFGPSPLLSSETGTMPIESSSKSGLADTSKVFDLDEIVIVSQPKEVQRMRHQPLSSSVFSGSDITAVGARDLGGLSAYVPSFVMPEYGSRLTSSMYVRGIGSRINNPAVGIYVDGIPLVSKNSFNFHTYQIDRIDVLRGPQGTLYGMNTEGGLVRVYSKDPMKYSGTDLRLGIGTNFYRNAEIAHYHRPNNRLAFSVAGFYNGQDGFFKNTTTGKRADNYNEAGGKTRLIYTPNGRFTVDFMADYQYVNQNAFPYGLLDLTDNSVAAPSANRPNEYRRNMLNSGLSLRYVSDVITFNSSTGYQYLDDCMIMDQDYLPQDYMHLRQKQLMNALTQEFTLKSNTVGAWQWTSGLFGSYQWLRTEAPVFFDSDFTGRISSGIQSSMYSAILKSMTDKMVAGGMPEAVAGQMAAAAIEKAGGISVSTGMSVPALFHTPQFNIGVFHESNISLSGRLTATIGLRYDYSHVKVSYETSAAMAVTAKVMGQEATNTLSSLLNNKTDDGYGQLLPKLGLSYRIDRSGSNVYVMVAKGYRAGGYNIQMFSDILQSELNANSSSAMRQDYDIPHTSEDYKNINSTISYKPEESWNYEFGAHLNLFENKIHADFSGYYMQIRNQQLSVMAGDYGFGRMMVNAGKSYSCGVEASLRGSALNDRLSWAAGYGFTHSVFKDYTETVGNEEVSYKDKHVPFVPVHTMSLTADYRIPFVRSAVKSLVIGADLTARGRTYWDEANTYSQPFYALLGAHADVTVNRLVFRVWCRNITDTHYNTFAFDSSASGSSVYLAQRGAPFQAGLDVRMSF